MTWVEVFGAPPGEVLLITLGDLYSAPWKSAAVGDLPRPVAAGDWAGGVAVGGLVNVLAADDAAGATGGGAVGGFTFGAIPLNLLRACIALA